MIASMIQKVDPAEVPATTTTAEAQDHLWDVIVVGAGPAGILAARALANEGHSVLLLDRSSFPRWKVCGCCLGGQALATLKQAGLPELPVQHGAVPIRDMLLAAGPHAAKLHLPAGVVLSRTALDSALLRQAIHTGVHFLPHVRVHHLSAPEWACRQENLRWVEYTPNPSTEDQNGPAPCRFQTRVVLIAAGLGTSHLGDGKRPSTSPASRIGVGTLVAQSPDFYTPGRVFMASGPGGYLGLVRLEDGQLNLAAAFHPTSLRQMGGPGQAAIHLLGEVGWPVPMDLPEANWRGTPTLTRQASTLAGPGWFVLGDAAGYVEPFTGEGMAWAMQMGLAIAPLVGQAIQRWDPHLPAAWSRLHRQRIAARQHTCRTAAGILRRPWLTRLLIRLLARFPTLAHPVVHHLNRG